MSNARTNNSSNASVDLTTVFASGTFKNVYAGSYTSGSRNRERCVAKEFKTGSMIKDHYYEEEVNIIQRTQKIVDDFSLAGVLQGGRQIMLNTPGIWNAERTGHKYLVEPMIKNFEKFNSNTGWASRSGAEWNEAMQALSHFSFHDSNRQFLLCDLQVGVYSNGHVLSDPVIMSQEQNYGPADLGLDGIDSFFHRHFCGRFCNQNWAKPRLSGRPVHAAQQGTSLVARLPTRVTRNPLSRLRE